MKSKRSYSKLTTFKKDITRFAPVWALYLIGLMLTMFESFNFGTYDRIGRNMGDLISSFGIVNLIYAGLIALMLFGDLYNTRMCYSLHTQPARRDALLLSHLAAGFLFSLVPNCVAALFLMVRLEGYWFLALLWLLASQMQFIFFFGLATVAAMLTGNRFAMLLVYVGMNFISMLAYWIANTIYLPMMEGVILDTTPFYRLCPVVDLASSWDFLQFQCINIPNQNYNGAMDYFYGFQGLGTGWWYMAILTAVGLALMSLALLLYRLRHLESAGDFVAFPKLKGAACVVMTVCIAGVFAFIGEAVMGSSYELWAIIGMIVGFFGSLMLLERRVKVFRRKTFAGFALLALVLIGSFLTVRFDVLGVVNWTPDARDVQSVTLSNYTNNRRPYPEFYYSNRMSTTLTAQEDIAAIIDAHEDILDRLDESDHMHGYNTHRVVLTYKLKNGRTVMRSYNAPASGTNYEIVSRYLYTPEQILGYDDWDRYIAGLQYLCINGCEVPKHQFLTVMEALRKDCVKGFVTTNGNKDSVTWVEIQTSLGNGNYTSRQVAVLPGAEHITALMKTPELILGYMDWESYLDNMRYVNIQGYQISAARQAELLEALRKDCANGSVVMGYSNTPVTYEITLEFSTKTQPNLYRYLAISKDAKNTITWLEENQDLFESSRRG